MEDLLFQWQARHNISNTKLAKLLNCHPSLITLLKNGERKWTAPRAEAMEILSDGEVPRLQLLYPIQKIEKSKPHTILNRIWRFLFSTNKET